MAPLRTVPAGESVLFVDPGEIPAAGDVARLGQALAAPRCDLYELMVHFAAYTGLRWGELAALTVVELPAPGSRGRLAGRRMARRRWRRYSSS